jgi:hypothetical protein
MRLRLCAILGLGLVVGACSNLVYSERPLFDGQPVAELTFRPGLWAAPDKGCRFNPARPLRAWPKCANAGVFKEAGPIDYSIIGENPVVFANGGEMIIQSENENHQASSRPDAASLSYSYLAIGEIRRDAEGRITRFQEWFPQCGPPHGRRHKLKANAKIKSAATRHPFPELLMRGDNCEATNAAAVRYAATASKAFGVMGARWMRDGDH